MPLQICIDIALCDCYTIAMSKRFPDWYVSREIETALMQRLETFSAVAITGPRQTGKSTLLRALLPEYRYITLDDPFTLQQAVSDPELLLASLGNHVIVDEIQYAPSLLPYIKMRIDDHRSLKGQFVLTGSQQFVLTKHLSESLAGRIGLLELLPFSATELAVAKRLSADTSEQFQSACLHGLYPEPALAPNIASYAWYSAYMPTYLQRDIRFIYDIGNLREFDNLMRLLAARCAQQLNMSTLSAEIGVSVNTVKRWVSILEACRIVYLLSPYHNNLGKRVTKAPKIYFTDCGVVCHLTRLHDFDHLMQGPLAGPLFENFCIQEALKAAFNQGASPSFYYLRTQSGLEVDLLVEGMNGRLIPFEFKLAKTPKTNMGTNLERFAENFAELNPEKGTVVSLSERTNALSPSVSLLPFQGFVKAISELSR